MEISKTLYVKNRKEWRAWLEKHHKVKDIWLVYYKKHSGKARIPYNDAVEEALCYGWIDSTVKRVDEDSVAQRFTPRRKGSPMSEMNKERVRRLIKAGLMTEHGMMHIDDTLNRRFVPAPDILNAIKQNKDAWKYYKKLPLGYRRVRIGYIEEMRNSPEQFKKSLANFIKITAKDKKFGMVQ